MKAEARVKRVPMDKSGKEVKHKEYLHLTNGKHLQHVLMLPVAQLVCQHSQNLFRRAARTDGFYANGCRLLLIRRREDGLTQPVGQQGIKKYNDLRRERKKVAGRGRRREGRGARAV